MSETLLEQRLETLAVETPDAGRITARVLARSRRPQRRRAPRVAGMGVASLALIVLVAYFVPAADLAMANVPVAGDLLRSAGLVGAAGRITAVGTSSSSSGYKLRLDGVYADSTRTVLLLHADPPIQPVFNAIQLTDQLGRAVAFSGGTGDLRGGDNAWQFEALPWPDAITGARLTLRMAAIEPADLSAPQISGSWTLQATVGVDQGTALALPQPATTGPAHYRFTSVSYTPATVAIEIDITGLSMSELTRIIPGGVKPSPAFTIDLIDPNGNLIDGDWGISEDVLGRPHVHFLGFRMIGGGTYVLRIAYAGYGQFERTISIP